MPVPKNQQRNHLSETSARAGASGPVITNPRMKKLLSLICSIVLLSAVAGCSDNDEKAGFDQTLLLGTWQLTERYKSNAEGESNETVRPGEVIKRTFRADGTGTENIGKYYEEFTYWVDSYLWFDYGDNDRSAYEVESLTDTVLVLVQSGSDEDGDWLERDTYVRISE